MSPRMTAVGGIIIGCSIILSIFYFVYDRLVDEGAHTIFLKYSGYVQFINRAHILY